MHPDFRTAIMARALWQGVSVSVSQAHCSVCTCLLTHVVDMSYLHCVTRLFKVARSTLEKLVLYYPAKI